MSDVDNIVTDGELLRYIAHLEDIYAFKLVTGKRVVRLTKKGMKLISTLEDVLAVEDMKGEVNPITVPESELKASREMLEDSEEERCKT